MTPPRSRHDFRKLNLAAAGLEPTCPSLGAQKAYGKRANHCSAFLAAPTHAWVVWLSWLHVPEPCRDVKSTPLTDHEIFTLYRGQTRKRLRDIHMLHLWPDFQNFDRGSSHIKMCIAMCRIIRKFRYAMSQGRNF